MVLDRHCHRRIPARVAVAVAVARAAQTGVIRGPGSALDVDPADDASGHDLRTEPAAMRSRWILRGRPRWRTRGGGMVGVARG